MGLRKDLMGMAKEFKSDPHGQFFRKLDTLLKIGHHQIGIPKHKIIKHVKEYFGEK
jgi:hypothetical protein